MTMTQDISDLNIFDIFKNCFTDLVNTFDGRLSAVIPLRGGVVTGEATGTQSKFIIKIKAPYSRELMRQIEEGMLVAIPNFKSSKKEARLALFEITEVRPQHFGLTGLSDSSFYPLQMEILRESEVDWQESDISTMIVQIQAIPINYSLVISMKGQNQDQDHNQPPKFVKRFDYPIPGSPVKILNEKIIDQMYNEKVLKIYGWESEPWGTETDPRINPRLGTLNMFDGIPLYMDYDSLVRYHFGIFAFTGGGKSNLLSNVMRRILYHTDNKIVIFDVSSEYPFLLADILVNPDIPSKIVLESPVHTAEQFYQGVVRPRKFENDDRFKPVFEKILEQGKVTNFARSFSLVPSYQDMVEELDDMKASQNVIDKPHYVDAIDELQSWILEYVQDHDGVNDKSPVSIEFVDLVSSVGQQTMMQYNVHEKSGLFAWAGSRSSIKRKIQKQMHAKENKEDKKGSTVKDIESWLQGDTRLVVISIADANILRDIVIELTASILYSRKTNFTLRPYILFVLDEAQEFLPAYSIAQGNAKLASTRVETLLRQGRKYGLGVCLATQRVAYLNTNALQQLHTFFVGPLPRPYDRMVVSSTFLIDTAILEKTLEFSPGQFLLSSYVASGIDNVPILFTADNNEDVLESLIEEESKTKKG